MQVIRILGLFFIVTGLISCDKVALFSIASKKPQQSSTALAAKAQRYFWKTLHSGSYKDLSQADYLLMAAYLQNPNDPKLAAHLGFVHIWKITERQRNKNQLPTITDEMVLSKKYFSDSLVLDPTNPIYQGFLGDTQLIEGKIFHDQREEVQGYFTLKKAIHAWPEFNYFTAGYPMSTLTPESKHFKEGLKWQWLTLDACAGHKIDRKNPNYAPYMANETRDGKKRACWNSWIAPHNFEGFFMNMGDMLVKSGDWQTGVKIYQTAKLSKNYAFWPYRTMLEKRIHNARENVTHFQRDTSQDEDKTIMFNSGYGCVACHQNT